LKLKLALLLLFAAVWAAAQTDASGGHAAGGRRALLIANSAYQHLQALTSPKVNADALNAALTKADFHTQVEYDLSQAKMLSTIAAFSQAIQPGDFALIYFSGYGFQDDKNYLLPVSFDPKDNSFTSQKAVSVRNLEDQLARAATKMLILDASRQCADYPEGLAPMQHAANTLVAFAAGPNQVAPDPPGGGLNAFTAALINAIQEPGSTPGGVLEHAQAEVDHFTAGKQVPFFSPVPWSGVYFTDPLPVAPPVVIEPKHEFKPGESRENPKDRLIYVWVPPGTFKMGCVPDDKRCDADEKPRHDVKISKGFWMTGTEVKAGAYQKFVSATGNHEPGKTQTRTARDTDLPVTKVSWDDVAAYCAWAGGRLPTEAEWEYAARGGKPDLIFPWGNHFDPKLVNYGKTDLKSKKPFFETLPVDMLENANEFGLLDMAGNVREWTADFYDPLGYAAAGAAADPTGPAAGKERVVRGGSFNSPEKDLRVSARDKLDPIKFDKGDNQTGFRCVLPKLGSN
jgi:formylglycine-generating enzyme